MQRWNTALSYYFRQDNIFQLFHGCYMSIYFNIYFNINFKVFGTINYNSYENDDDNNNNE